MIPLVLGEEEIVLGFRLIGVKGVTPADPDAALRELESALAAKEPPLLLVTERVAQWIRPQIRSAILAGAMIQVIPGLGEPIERRVDEEALLLSALGVKL
ncbi:MAG: V-type ATP synthase subunit F [Candidatus Binataceae bacterium]|jgi:vacuolar-type H+-ATPase subunit F/Vma7